MSIIADTVLKNGSVYTVNEKQKWAEAVAVKDSGIVFVGDNEAAENYIGTATRVIDLQQKMVLPGFIDSHAHPIMGEVNILFDVNLYDGESLQEYLEAVGNYIKTNPDAEFITGYGWSNTVFSNRGPLASDLDAVSTDIPIALHSADYHSIWANSKAIELAGVDKTTEDPAGGVIERLAAGEPSGTFRENAQEIMKAVIPEPSVAQYKEALKSYQNKAVRLGITSSYEAWVMPESNMLKAYREADADHELLINMFSAVAPSPVDPEKGLEFIRRGNLSNGNRKFHVKHIKLFIDGVVEGKTAMLKQPYDNKTDFTGEPVWKEDLLRTVTEAADKNGFDMHFHVIGDAAVEKMLDLLDELDRVNGNTGRRTIAAHIQLINDADISRLTGHDVVFSSNPFWHYKAPGYFEDIEVKYLGEARANTEYPLNSLISKGVVTSAGSDYPISPDPSPLLGIRIGMTRQDPDAETVTEEDTLNIDERVSLEEMIRCFTINGAYANRLEDQLGSIETGKRADMVILSRNIFEVSAESISAVEIEATMADGTFIYSKDGSKL